MQEKNCLNERSCRLPRRGHTKKSKIHLQSLKIFFSRTICPISIKPGAKHPSVKETQGFTNKDHSDFKKEKTGFPNQCYDI